VSLTKKLSERFLKELSKYCGFSTAAVAFHIALTFSLPINNPALIIYDIGKIVLNA